jgi:hypothetical protein
MSFTVSEWFMPEWSARTVIRPHGEEARARDATAMVLMFRARAVSNHEGGPICRLHIGFYVEETGRLIASSISATMPRDAL